jgi:FkbM family methyltransferase
MVSGATMELDVSDRVQGESFLLGRYELDTVEFIASRLPPEGIFFDVGAHVGLISFDVAARVPGASVHAFEPDPGNAARWRRNRTLNPSARATLEAAAVADIVGHAHLTGPIVGESAWRHVVDQATDGTRTVPMTTLDSYAEVHGVEVIDVLKLDVEGYEPRVLDGARELLRARSVRCLVLEINEVHLRRNGHDPGDLAQRLTRSGMRQVAMPKTGVGALRRPNPELHEIAFEPARDGHAQPGLPTPDPRE